MNAKFFITSNEKQQSFLIHNLQHLEFFLVEWKNSNLFKIQMQKIEGAIEFSGCHSLLMFGIISIPVIFLVFPLFSFLSLAKVVSTLYYQHWEVIWFLLFY